MAQLVWFKLELMLNWQAFDFKLEMNVDIAYTMYTL